jgi:hypothetical protein
VTTSHDYCNQFGIEMAFIVKQIFWCTLNDKKLRCTFIKKRYGEDYKLYSELMKPMFVNPDQHEIKSIWL